MCCIRVVLEPSIAPLGFPHPAGLGPGHRLVRDSSELGICTNGGPYWQVQAQELALQRKKLAARHSPKGGMQSGQARSLQHPHVLQQSMAVLWGRAGVPLLTPVLPDKRGKMEMPDGFSPSHSLHTPDSAR